MGSGIDIVPGSEGVPSSHPPAGGERVENIQTIPLHRNFTSDSNQNLSFSAPNQEISSGEYKPMVLTSLFFMLFYYNILIVSIVCIKLKYVAKPSFTK